MKRAQMQIAENWSRIRGKVQGWEPPTSAGDSGTLTIAVEHVGDVASTDGSSHRNLMGSAAGTVVRVIVPASAASHVRVAEGATAVVTVRRVHSADQVFAHPEHIQLSST